MAQITWFIWSFRLLSHTPWKTDNDEVGGQMNTHVPLKYMHKDCTADL